jgi:hypothetical protein
MGEVDYEYASLWLIIEIYYTIVECHIYVELDRRCEYGM